MGVSAGASSRVGVPALGDSAGSKSPTGMVSSEDAGLFTSLVVTRSRGTSRGAAGLEAGSLSGDSGSG